MNRDLKKKELINGNYPKIAFIVRGGGPGYEITIHDNKTSSSSKYGSSKINALSANGDIAVGYGELWRAFTLPISSGKKQSVSLFRQAIVYNIKNNNIYTLQTLSRGHDWHNAEALDITADGKFIIGWSDTDNVRDNRMDSRIDVHKQDNYHRHGFIFYDNTLFDLGTLGNNDDEDSEAHSITDDGRTIFGASTSTKLGKTEWRRVIWNINHNNKTPSEEYSAEQKAIHNSKASLLKRKTTETKAEQDRLEQQAKEKAEQNRLEQQAKEKAEQDRLEQQAKEKAEQDRLEQQAKEKAEQDRLEQQAKEKAEQDRLNNEAKEKAEQDRLEQQAKEKAEQDRLEQQAKEKAEQDRLNNEAKEKAEQDRLEQQAKEKAEQDRLEQQAKEKAEQDRLEQQAKEKAEQDRLEQQAKEKAEQDRLEQQAKEKAEQDRLEQQAKEKAEQDRLNNEAKEKAEQDRLEQQAKEKAEQDRLNNEAKEKAEQDRLEQQAKEKAEQDRLEQQAKEKAEQDRLNNEAKEKAEQDRLNNEAKKKAEQDHLEQQAKEKAEQDCLEQQAKEEAEQENTPATEIVISQPIDIENTYRSMQLAAENGYKLIDMQQGQLRYLTSATCNVGTEKACISGFTHHQRLNKANATQTGISGAYRIDINKIPLVVGLAIDTDMYSSLPKGYTYQGYPLPLIGFSLDLIPSLNPEAKNNALHMSLKGAYLNRKVSIERARLENTEAGKGQAKLAGYHIELAGYYPYSVTPIFTLTPFAGLTLNEISRSAYSETQGANFVAHYDKLKEQILSAKLGLGVDYLLGSSFILNTKAGLLWGLSEKQRDFRSNIDYLGQQHIEYSDNKKTLKQRPFANVGVTYQWDKHSSLGTSADWEMTTHHYHNLQFGVNYTYRF